MAEVIETATGIDVNTAMHEINMMTTAQGFAQAMADAYYLQPIGSLLPLILLAIVVIAVYGKTQNIPATVVATTLTFVVMYPWASSVMGATAQYLQPIFGLLILASAYVVWRWVMYGTSG